MKITDPAVIEAIADLILANRRERAALGNGSSGAYGIPRVVSARRAISDGDRQEETPVVAAQSVEASQ